MFSNNVGVCDFNEENVISILEALRLFYINFDSRFFAESDSNTVGYLIESNALGNFNFILMKLESFVPRVPLSFLMYSRSANFKVYALTK